MQNTQEMLIAVSTDGDDIELDTLAAELLEELSLLPVAEVEPVTSGEVPENARALEAIVLGKLAVKFGPQVLSALAGTLKAWLQRSSARSVALTIDGDTITLNKASSEDQKRLLDVFIQKHSGVPEGA